MKEFYSDIAHKACKNYQEVIHNTYNGGQIETDYHVILLIPEEVSKHFALPKFNTQGTGTLREVLENYTTTRDKIYLSGLVVTKVK